MWGALAGQLARSASVPPLFRRAGIGKGTLRAREPHPADVRPSYANALGASPHASRRSAGTGKGLGWGVEGEIPSGGMVEVSGYRGINPLGVHANGLLGGA